MSDTISNLLNHPFFWRSLGFCSGVVGLICYASSPTFEDMFGEWNYWKMAIYSVVSSIFPSLVLCVKELGLKKNLTFEVNVCFLVFLLTCLHSFYEEKSNAGKDESDYSKTLSLLSSGGLALMSMSLSRQTNIGFELGVSNFFLANFFLCAMKLNFKVAMGTALICYVVVDIRSYSDSRLEMQGGGDNDTGRAYLRKNLNTLVEKTAMGYRGNQEKAYYQILPQVKVLVCRF